MDTQEIGTLCACVREAGQIIGVPAVTCASVPERREEGKSTHQQIDRGRLGPGGYAPCGRHGSPLPSLTRASTTTEQIFVSGHLSRLLLNSGQ